MKALDLVYNKAVEGIPGTEGIPGMGSVEDFAQSYMKGEKSLEGKVDSLIRFQVAKCSASGFLSGLGGFVTLPVTLPANLLSVFYIQLQMSAAIAHMGGYDVRDDRVKTFCLVSLCGESASKLLRGVGVTIGKKMTEQMIRNLSVQIIYKINKAVGFRLLTKTGSSGVIVLSRGIPLVGGAVGGTFDGVTTYTVGEAAKRIFIKSEEVQANYENDSPSSQEDSNHSKNEYQWSFDNFLQKELTEAEDFLFGNNEKEDKEVF